MKASWTLLYVSVSNSEISLLSVCQFRNGNCHIVVHKGCWAVVSRGRLMNRVFSEAAELLQKLPPDPTNYPPYVDFMAQTKMRIVQGD